MVWIQIIWVQTVFKDHLQMTKFVASRQRAEQQ